jgi:hypothetical protein
MVFSKIQSRLWNLWRRQFNNEKVENGKKKKHLFKFKKSVTKFFFWFFQTMETPPKIIIIVAAKKTHTWYHNYSIKKNIVWNYLNI